MPESLDRTANLLGAAALNIVDQMLSAASEAGGISASGAATLITLADYAGIGVSELGERIGLSQSATVRLVDSLASRGLLQRLPGRDGRARALALTTEGETLARELLTARHQYLDRLVGHLDVDERAALERALEVMLVPLYDDVGSHHVVCRMCDRGACLADGAVCPVGQASRERGA